MAVPVSDLQSVAPSAIIELFVLELNATQHGANATYRFHAGVNTKDSGSITWAGDTYISMPIEAEGFEYSGNGQLPRPKIRVSNVFGTITAILSSLPSGLEGAKVRRLRTLARYLDAVNFTGNINPFGTPDPTAAFPEEIYYIDRKSAENRDLIEFELVASFDLSGVRAPKRQCVANICQWKYRSTECGYTGNAYYDINGNTAASLALDVCGKRLTDCKLRFAPLRSLGTVALGSNIITLDTATAVETGALVSGFGIPSGTTVLSYSGNNVTISANATATTTLTKTGTLSTDRISITLSDVTGLAVGMTVSGPKIVTGTSIAAITGNVITLGLPVNLIDVLGLQFTKTGSLVTAATVVPALSSSYLSVSSITSINAGMYVTGPTIDVTDRAIVQGFVYTTFAGSVVDLSYAGNISGSTGTYNFYTLQNQTSQTYSFTAASRVYSFRADTGIPFGSFPGIGTYLA